MIYPVIYFLIIVAWIMLLVGLYFKDYPITAFSGMLLMIFGVYLTRSGFPYSYGILTSALSYIHIVVGGYVLIRGTWEQYAKY